PPDPIPNSEVKRTCADGSVHPACESRSSPGSLPKTPSFGWGFFFARWIVVALRCCPGIRGWPGGSEQGMLGGVAVRRRFPGRIPATDTGTRRVFPARGRAPALRFAVARFGEHLVLALAQQ